MRGPPDIAKLCTRPFRTKVYATAAVLKSWRNRRFRRTGWLATALAASHRAVRCKTLRPRLAPGRRQLRRQVDRGAKVDLVRGLAGEGRMWHLGVVLLDEKLYENSEPLNRVEGVEVKPLVFQGSPERGARSSKPQTAAAARFHRWYRPGSICAIRKITASERNGVALVMARRIPALAAPLTRRSPARVKPDARSIARRTRATAARMRARRSSFTMVSTNCCRSWSSGSMVTTGR